MSLSQALNQFAQNLGRYRNLGGYHGALSLGNRNRVNLGGLSDAAFSLLSFDTGTKWPWEL